MRVIACLATEHNPWLVLLAALICVAGSWVTLVLFRRSGQTEGFQRGGWIFLTAIAAGSSVWCTHFVAMLAYDPKAPVLFDPILTFASLLIAIVGMGLGLGLASGRAGRYAPEAGGAIVGLSIAAMHYTGMTAYRIDGIVEWDAAHVAASVAISVVLAVAAISLAVRRPHVHAGHAALALFVLAIVGLHFTGMAALAVYPMPSGVAGTAIEVIEAMAIAVAGVGLVIAGTGAASYLIDDRVRLESMQTLRHMALNDSLTGLPNRASFAEHLDHELARARQQGCKVAMVGIDLDRFKEINDLRGHGAGDEALCMVARRLVGILEDDEFVARLGGDEFGAVKRYRQQADLLDFVGRLETALFRPLRIGDFESVAGASLGVAVFPEDGADRERLVGNADLAMYRAKADVTRAVCFYEQTMDEAARARRNLSNDLRQAIERGELELHYQVQTSVATGEIRGYEVLLRWTHPVRGQVPPSEFIPVAEETGAILPIGEWVLRQACRQATAWDKPYKIAVNLSPVQFAHADLARLVFEILVETGLSPSRLELELTESTIIADKARTLHVLRQIRGLGVTIAIDDFGTGYSSLDTLRTFPFDKIKLDRSFMREVENNPQAKAIVRAVLALGKSLDIRVLAEGVETADQLAILRHEGCDEAQGYLLGHPRPVGQIFPAGADTAPDPAQPDSSGRDAAVPPDRRASA